MIYLKFPKVKKQTGKTGVNFVERIVIDELEWIFRREEDSDFGIDGQIEIVEKEMATGRLIAAQVKAGESYFEEKNQEGIVYRGDIEHLNQWSNHSLSVIVILCDLKNKVAYWQHVNRENVELTGKAWKMTVPYAQKLDRNARDILTSLEAYRSAFTRYENFFKPFMNPSSLLNHTYTLVGFGNVVRDLHKFVNSKKKIALLYGRGGIGKSRILYEFSSETKKKHPKHSLLLVRDEIEIDAQRVHRLPATKCIIIVDDAHRREDLKCLLSLVKEHHHDVRLILSLRPHKLEYIESSVIISGFDPRDIMKLDEIKELGTGDLKKLAQLVLGESNSDLLEALAHAAKESPLVIVVGGRFLAEKKIHPLLLERHSDFPSAIFNRFQDELYGAISNKITPENYRDLLSLIAALSPIRPLSEEFKKRASEFIGIDSLKLIEAIDMMEKSGILLRRGNLLKITPDVLSDHILGKACVTSNGDATGYAKKVFDRFADLLPENVLQNLAELDWRVNAEGKKIHLISDIWRVLENEFRKASHYERKIMLRWVEKIAVYQPSRALALIEYALRNPATKTDPENDDGLYKFTHNDVVASLPEILRRIGLHLEYLPRCCDLLWSIGKNDKRETNTHPGHAIRILSEIAGYDIGKQKSVHRIILAAVERWLKEPDAQNCVHSPLAILEGMLQKVSTTDYAEGYKIVMRSFLVSYESTKSLRDKALLLIKESAVAGPINISLTALRVLIDGLNDPIGIYNLKIKKKDKTQWIPEQMEILEIIKTILGKKTDPILLIQTASDLEWFAKRASNKEVRNKAKEVISLISDTFDIRMYRALWYRYDFARISEDHNEYYKRVNSELEIAASEFLKKFPITKKAIGYLEKTLSHFKSIDSSLSHKPEPRRFIEKISEMNLKLAEEISKHIIDRKDSHLSLNFAASINPIMRKDKNKAIDIIKKAIETGNDRICLSVAHGYSSWGWAQKLSKDDIKVIRALLSYSDQNVKLMTLDCLRRIEEPMKKVAINLALLFDCGKNEKYAEKICSLFDHQYGISPDSLSDDDISKIVSKLEPVNEIRHSSHYIDRFLGYVTKRNPSVLIDFFLARLRIKGQEEYQNHDYQPISAQGYSEAFKNISSSPEYCRLLKKVRDQALISNEDLVYFLSHLYRYMSNGYSKASLDALDEWIETGESDKIIAAACLLQSAPSRVVFENVDLISKLLEKSYLLGEESHKKVRENLFKITVSGGGFGSPGKPMPKDVKLNEDSEKVMKDFPPGSASFRFFESVRDHAEHQIKNTLIEDEEFLMD